MLDYERNTVLYLDKFLYTNFKYDWTASTLSVVHNPELKLVYIKNVSKRGSCIYKIDALLYDLGIKRETLDQHEITLTEDNFFKFYVLIKLQGGIQCK